MTRVVIAVSSIVWPTVLPHPASIGAARINASRIALNRFVLCISLLLVPNVGLGPIPLRAREADW